MAYDEDVSKRESIWIFSNDYEVTKYNALEQFYISKDVEVLLYAYYYIVRFNSNYILDNLNVRKLSKETLEVLKIINPYLELQLHTNQET